MKIGLILLLLCQLGYLAHEMKNRKTRKTNDGKLYFWLSSPASQEIFQLLCDSRHRVLGNTSFTKHTLFCALCFRLWDIYTVIPKLEEKSPPPFASYHSTRGTIDLRRAPTAGTDRVLVLPALNNDFQNQRRRHG